ncbi:MAG: phosphomannomutase/phosphoglucomutase [Phycisphaerae bacterium]|nr:phosphomannomutase/phosphoglucomutase [Phycisphaerae bacterium]
MDDLDKVFKAYDVRGVYPKEIDEDLAWKVGHACGQFLRSLLSGYERGQASSNRLVIGRDMRPSSESLAQAAIEGITSSGAGCSNIGLCDTPMVYFAVNHLGTCGGIQVTASHNPIQYNGFKVSGAKARPVGVDTGLKEIQRIAMAVRRMPVEASVAPASQVDLWEPYRKHVLRFLRTPRRLKVVVDASNGMGGKMIPQVFGDADVKIIPLNFEIGQGFVHEPNPLVEANLRQLKTAVKRHRADLVVCMDGDADRCVFVDEHSQTVPGDLMTALLAKYFLRENPGSTVVYDLRSSRVVAEEIRAVGGVPRRERVGHAFIKKSLADGHGIFGGELSGHFYFRDNFNCDSGAIAFASALSVIAQHERSFSQLVAPLRRYCQSGEINFSVTDKAAKMQDVAQAFSDAEIDDLDGVTVQYESWWCNVRPSNTEPLLRLNVEARDEKTLKDKLKKLQAILGRPVAR